MDEQTTQVAEQPFVKGKNGLGLAGFIIALVGLILSWIPIINLFAIVLLTVAFILSLIGLITGIVKKKKLGLAITGLILSCVGSILSLFSYGLLQASHMF